MGGTRLVDECRSALAAVLSGRANYYQYLELGVTATQQEIEAALEKKKRQADALGPEDSVLAGQMGDLQKRISLVLLDYQERARYDGRGFREYSQEDESPPEPEEQAKEIYQKAKALYAQKRYRDCFLAMTQALKLDGSKAGYYLLIGLAQSHLIEYRRDAEVNLSKAAGMEAWNAEPLVALGLLFYREKLMNRALAYFKRALELDANHSVARKYRDELAGPEEGLADKVVGVLSKVMPTFFKKK